MIKQKFWRGQVFLKLIFLFSQTSYYIIPANGVSDGGKGLLPDYTTLNFAKVHLKLYCTMLQPTYIHPAGCYSSRLRKPSSPWS